MKPILTFLALNGIRNIMYVDNGRTAASTKAKADCNYGFAIDTFVKAGFTIAEDKSDKVGDSVQQKEYLGFKIDSVGMAVFVPVLKMALLQSQLMTFLGLKSYKVRDVASMSENSSL
jgi:hypothetical protein